MKIIKYFLLLLPFIDLITAILVRNNIFFTPGIMIKSAFLLIASFYVFNSKSKYSLISRIFILVSFLYVFMYFFFKNEIFINFSLIFNELQFIFKLIYSPILFLFFLCFFDDNSLDNRKLSSIFKNTYIIYYFMIFIPIILGISYFTYPFNLKGFVGLFYAGNEIANILVILFSSVLFHFLNKKFGFIVALPFIVLNYLIGTKVSTFGTLIVVILYFLYSIFNKNIRVNYKLYLVLIFALLFSFNSYAVTNYKYNYGDNILDSDIVIDDTYSEEVDKIIDEMEVFYSSNSLTKKVSSLLNGRDILFANALSIYNNNKDVSTLLFGIGFSNTESINNSNVARLIEIDVLDGFLHYGLIGVTIMFAPLLFTFYLVIMNLKKLKLDSMFIIMIILLMCAVSTFSGHVFLAPAVVIYFNLLLIYLLNNIGLLGRKYNLKDEISIMSLHMGVGGIEQSIVRQANMLAKEYKVKIVSLYNNGNLIYDLDKNIELIYLSNLFPNRDVFRDALKNKHLFNILVQGLKSIYILYKKWLLVTKYVYNCDSKVLISTRLYFTKVVNKYAYKDVIKIAEEHVYHNNDVKYLKELQNSLKNIDYLIPASKYLTDFYSDYFKYENVNVVYLPQVIDQLPKKHIIKGKNVLFVGRLEKEKGVLDLINIIKEVNNKDKSIKFTICGDGSLREKMVNELSKNNLLAFVKIKGFLSPNELKNEYLNSSLFVMTSYEESFGLVLLEAMSYGLTCIAYDSALGAKEIIANNSGFLIKNRCEQQFVNKILDFYSKKVDFNIDSYNIASSYYAGNVSKLWIDFFKHINKAKIKKTTLFISSTGGHLNELMMLKSTIDNCNSYIITEDDNASSYLKDIYKNRVRFLKATSRYQISYFVYGLFNIILSFYYFLRICPDVVISTGSHTAVPMCYIAKLFGKRVIYIESFANIKSKTLAGRIVYPIADIFVVQWEEMLQLYPKAECWGWIY